MPLLKRILADRRVWTVVLLGCAALIVGRWIVGPDTATWLVANGGYWLMLLTSVLFARAVWRLGRDAIAGWRPCRFDVGALVLVIGCGSVWVAHERQGFKILADEVLLLGTSMVMHQEREVSYPIRGTDLRGPFELTHRVLDKRPYFFPFLVSLLHDVTGYRGTNPFYLNAFLGFLFLGLVYVMGWRIAGHRGAGVLLVLLFTGLPLLAQQAAGGGFELLNLVMISAVLILGWRYAAQPDETSQEALCLAAVLLAFTRYESVLFVLPAAALVLWGWARAEKVILSWPVIIAPVLLLPYILQNRVFESNFGAWELASRPEASVPFSLAYVPDNLGHALGFFFDTTWYQPNSLLFGAIGLMALPFFLLIIVRTLRAGRAAAPTDFVVAMVGLGLFCVGLLFMAYFWGQFDDPVIRRLSLPVHLLMALAVVAVGTRLLRSPAAWRWACGAAVGALLLQGVPSMARQAYAWEYMPGIEMAWRADFLRNNPQKDYLFIDRDSVFWIANRVAATAVSQAEARREGLAYHLRNHSFSAMYVFQRFKVDETTGALTLDPADDVGPDFELATVLEKRIATLHLARISRVVAIRDASGGVVRAGRVPVAEGAPLPADQAEKARADYMATWMKKLP